MAFWEFVLPWSGGVISNMISYKPHIPRARSYQLKLSALKIILYNSENLDAQFLSPMSEKLSC
jgi:hypothetical protein